MFSKAILCLALCAPFASAGLIGQSVTGTLAFNGGPTNWFDPVNGFVPVSGYLNTAGATVTIADPAVEFGFNDSVNLDTADFTAASQLIISDSTSSGSAPAVYTFTSSTPGLFTGVSLNSNSNSAFQSVALVGDTITVTYTALLLGADVTPQIAPDVTTIDVTTSAVPEPSTLLLSALGLAGFAAWQLRRRFFFR
jgi:hypothetical protein